MNIKMLIFSLIALILVDAKVITPEEFGNTQANRNLHEELLRRYGNPRDPNVTPTTPQRIYNWQGLVGGRNFYRRRIFFDKNKDGSPIYKSIEQHAQENPKFGNVTLAIFHKAAWYKLNFSDTFEIVGNYSDEGAQKIAMYSMTPLLWESNYDRGGMWCPLQNAIVAGDGTQDPEICDRFAQYIKEQKEAEQSGQSKGKKIISSNKSENETSLVS